MEMEKMIGAGAVSELEDPVEARPAADTWPLPATEKESRRRRRALLVAGVVSLLLVAFFVLVRESASTLWEITSGKLAGLNDGATHHHDGDGDVAGGNVTNRNVDELLGGLLTAGMDRRSCRSRYESSWYYKHFPYKPSTHLLGKLRAYEARHRRCAPGTPLYANAIDHLKSGGRSAAADEAAMEECRYIVWLPFDGLGNRMLSMASGFLYALLTDRVFLVALPPDSSELFCEPFPDTTWRLPLEDFPIANLFNLGPNPDVSLTALLNSKKIVVDVDGDNATAATPLPAYVYLSLGYQMTDGPFFCDENQAVLGKVSWLLLYSDLYFAPSLYPIAKFQDELRRLFPAKESAGHLLLRYLLHPTNPVWDMVTTYYNTYLAYAHKRIGLQIRMFNFASIPANDLYNQILSCSEQEHILPETGDEVAAGNSTAIFIASLYNDYYERLKVRYHDKEAKVDVFQRTHEQRQATENLAHNQRALAEIFLLSFSEELVTSGMSTFGYVSYSLAGVRPTILLPAHGHKVPATPCRRAVSMEPCNLTPPRGVTCRGKGVDGEDLDRHLKVCEDREEGVKLFD